MCKLHVGLNLHIGKCQPAGMQIELRCYKKFSYRLGCDWSKNDTNAIACAIACFSLPCKIISFILSSISFMGKIEQHRTGIHGGLCLSPIEALMFFQASFPQLHKLMGSQ